MLPAGAKQIDQTVDHRQEVRSAENARNRDQPGDFRHLLPNVKATIIFYVRISEAKFSLAVPNL